MASEDTKEAFAAADTNGDGRISYEEFEEALGALCTAAKLKDANTAVRLHTLMIRCTAANFLVASVLSAERFWLPSY